MRCGCPRWVGGGGGQRGGFNLEIGSDGYFDYSGCGCLRRLQQPRCAISTPENYLPVDLKVELGTRVVRLRGRAGLRVSPLFGVGSRWNTAAGSDVNSGYHALGVCFT